MDNQTLDLLQKCATGCKMAIRSLEEVIPYVQSKELRKEFQETLRKHNEYLSELKEEIFDKGKHVKEPSWMAQIMGSVTTRIRIMQEESDDHISSMILEGCDMGIKEIGEALAINNSAEERAKELAKRLLTLETNSRNRLEKIAIF